MGANEFRSLSDLDFQNEHSASLLKILIKVGLISIFIHNFFQKYMIRGKVAVAKNCGCYIAPTTSKSMGAEAPTAPILTGAPVRFRIN